MKSLYQQILTEDFAKLAPVLQALHGAQGAQVQGTLAVGWTRAFWPRLLPLLARMPAASPAASCRVDIAPATRTSERWQRVIGGRAMNSLMQAGTGAVIVEHVGPIAAPLSTWVDAEGGLHQRCERVVLRGLGWPVPGLTISASEQPIDARRYHCRVKVDLARFGTLIHYNGVLSLVEPTFSSTQTENP
ncbi:DUF4166 domain-containing protein [Pseudomonas batumici]|uniref:DUF4166 domain-containing protein n=1 Tax=Pseudomonas batumici TaxID=226910 RepID=A0A0C2F1M5_9PSED|nr:DUF4166 domain-containing protein [Pseudomonas batumici]KIH84943.1 hypothetical protein UCMB321_1271 [Pseudomonas batumici]